LIKNRFADPESLWRYTRPTAEMLSDIDTLVFDIQDVGTRFYTYISTLGNTMEEAAKNHLKYVVLDRRIRLMERVEGRCWTPIDFRLLAISEPVRHGMTIGELATLYNAENKINVDLTVIKMKAGSVAVVRYDGAHVGQPSPNMRSLTEAALYPGIGILETTMFSRSRDRYAFEITVRRGWTAGNWLLH